MGRSSYTELELHPLGFDPEEVKLNVESISAGDLAPRLLTDVIEMFEDDQHLAAALDMDSDEDGSGDEDTDEGLDESVGYNTDESLESISRKLTSNEMRGLIAKTLDDHFTADPFPDPRYPYVETLVHKDEDAGGAPFMQKNRDSADVAYHEAMALLWCRHLTNNGVSAYPLDRRVIVELVDGPTVYDLHRYTAGMIKACDLEGRTAERDGYLELRRRILERLVDNLAILQENPYVPKNGKVIKSNVGIGGLPEYYSSNFMRALGYDSDASSASDKRAEALYLATKVFNEVIPNEETRYFDFYSENDGLIFTDENRFFNIVASQDESIEVLAQDESRADENRTTDRATRIRQYVADNLRKLDAHHVTKIASKLEDLFFILDDPQLNTYELDQSDHKFSDRDRLVLYQRFLLQRQRLRLVNEDNTTTNGSLERRLGKVDELLEELIEEGEPVPCSKLEALLPNGTHNEMHYMAMGLYKSVRRRHLVYGGIRKHEDRIDTVMRDDILVDMGEAGTPEKAILLKKLETGSLNGLKRYLQEETDDVAIPTRARRYRIRDDREEEFKALAAKPNQVLFGINAVEYCRQKLRNFEHDTRVYERHANDYIEQMLGHAVGLLLPPESDPENATVSIIMPHQGKYTIRSNSEGIKIYKKEFDEDKKTHRETPIEKDDEFLEALHKFDSYIVTDRSNPDSEVRNFNRVLQLRYIQKVIHEKF